MGWECIASRVPRVPGCQWNVPRQSLKWNAGFWFCFLKKIFYFFIFSDRYDSWIESNIINYKVVCLWVLNEGNFRDSGYTNKLKSLLTTHFFRNHYLKNQKTLTNEVSGCVHSPVKMCYFIPYQTVWWFVHNCQEPHSLKWQLQCPYRQLYWRYNLLPCSNAFL